MKNYLLVMAAICLITISSLFSVSALYHGTFTVQVGQSPSVQVGSSPTVTVTGATTSSGGSGGSSSSSSNNGGPSTSGGSSTTVNFNTTGSSFSINPTANLNLAVGNNALVTSSNSSNQHSGITGSIIQRIASPVGISTIGGLALIAAVAVIITSRRKSNISTNNSK